MCRKLPARVAFFGDFAPLRGVGGVSNIACSYKKSYSPKGEEERFEVAMEKLRHGDKERGKKEGGQGGLFAPHNPRPEGRRKALAAGEKKPQPSSSSPKRPRSKASSPWPRSSK
jgi:hypothetical protein